MSSRAKKKNKSSRRAPGADPNEEEGIDPSKSEERWLEMFFGAIVLFAAAGGVALEAFGSWKVSLACGMAGAILAVVLVRRGETLF